MIQHPKTEAEISQRTERMSYARRPKRLKQYTFLEEKIPKSCIFAKTLFLEKKTPKKKILNSVKFSSIKGPAVGLIRGEQLH